MKAVIKDGVKVFVPVAVERQGRDAMNDYINKQVQAERPKPGKREVTRVE